MKEGAATGAEKRSSDVINAKREREKVKERQHEEKRVVRRKQPHI